MSTNILEYKCTCGGMITEVWHWKNSNIVCELCDTPVASNPSKVELRRSALNARDVGVPEELTFKTIDDIDDYFLN